MPRTYAPGGGALPLAPTLRAMDGRSGSYQQSQGELFLSLVGVVRLLPTLTASDYGSCQGGSAGRAGQRNRPSLATLIKRNALTLANSADPLRDQLRSTGGALNPEWTEWFMGWPIGATALPPSAMARSPSRPPSLGTYSEDPSR
ncbi:hypothetical protein [Thiocystis violacea]|uniref:hypothetical protein n=1 Tax=Thiocystis violacea TaxID=13725 RepID=UPI001F5B6C66|nr:hypothetical protein [Thiocystis violacea]